MIRRLTPDDAAALSRLLTSDAPVYRQNFTPFETTVEAITHVLDAARRDRFWGVTIDGALAGLIMLRGLDAGFDTPAFGVYIAQASSRHGLGRLAVAYAETWCRLEGCRELMLSVHTDNTHAKRVYEHEGFCATGEMTDRGHAIMRKRLVNP